MFYKHILFSLTKSKLKFEVYQNNLTTYTEQQKNTPLYIPILFETKISENIFMSPLKKEGHIALHMSVGRSVGEYVGLP